MSGVMAVERTFTMVKPDGVQRGLIGEVVSRFERKGLKIVAAKFFVMPKAMAEANYAEHKGKKFYEPLIKFITSGPVLAMVLEGENAIDVVRGIMGKTDPKEAQPGTIRGDFALAISRNVVHGSDSPAAAEREINIFFKPEELVSYERIDQKCLY